MADQGPILQPAIEALCLARVGVLLRNQHLILTARGRYGLALTKLRNALSLPSIAFDPRTLAAMRALCIYEVRFQTSL